MAFDLDDEELEATRKQKGLIKENSIEEDIKTVKELLKGAKDYGQYNGNKYFYSIENILKDYTKQKQTYKEIKEKVKKLEKENCTLKSFTSAIFNGSIEKDFVSTQKIKDKIEELNKQEKELQNSISKEEREEYSDANISFQLCDIEIKRKVLQEILKEREE